MGSATLQNGRLISTCSVSGDGNWHSFTELREGSAAHEIDAEKNCADAEPLPTGDVFAQNDCGKRDGDGAVERAEYTDNGDLLELHGAIAEDKRGGVSHAHAEGNRSRVARQLYRLPGDRKSTRLNSSHV